MKRYITVSTRASQPHVEAYLYSHTTVIATGATLDGNHHYYLLETTALVGADREDPSHAEYLANYQADRLLSGMHFSKVFETREKAEQFMADRHLARLTDVSV
jgi:hypothetical protein